MAADLITHKPHNCNVAPVPGILVHARDQLRKSSKAHKAHVVLFTKQPNPWKVTSKTQPARAATVPVCTRTFNTTPITLD